VRFHIQTELKGDAMTDFSDPEQRLDYLLRHGVDAYNKAMEDHFAKTVVETVNGFNIRLVYSMRFGALYMVDGLNRGHQTLDGARQIARGEA
jgi:hypothetical protein